MSGPIYNIASYIPSENAPCFSKKTYDKLIEFNIINKPHGLVKGHRDNTTMYRCNWEPYGILEFTEEHPFIYIDKLYSFSELINIHPNIKNVELIPYNDEETKYVYNFISYPIQIHENNMFRLSDNTYIIGAKSKIDIDENYFIKKMEILQNLYNNPETKEFIKKYTPTN